MAGSSAAGSLWVKLGLSSKSYEDGMKRAENIMKKFGNRMNTLGMRITQGVSLPLAAAGGAAIKMAADMETAQVALTTLMGSASAATKQMAQLKQFAASTPFQFTELLSATRRMMAFGFQAKETIPILRNLGNASFALGQGAEGVNNMILALGQMRMKGRAQSEELTRQLGQYVGAWQYLANYLQVDVKTAMSMVEKRMIDGETAVKAVLLGIANDPKFKDGMAKQVKTLMGKWSNFKDQLAFTLADIGGLLVKTFDLKGVINNVRSAMKAFSDWFAKLDPGMRKLIAYGGAAAAAFGLLLIVIGKMSLGWSALVPVVGKTIGLISALGKVMLGTSAATTGVAMAGTAGAAATGALATGATAATGALAGLAAALVPFLIGAAVVAGLVGIVALIIKFKNASKDAIKNYEKLAAANESKKNVDNLAQSYGKLTDKINNAKPNSKEWKDLKTQQQALFNQIAKNYPSVVTAYDKIGNARKIDLDLLQQLIDKEDELENKRLINSQKQAKKAAQSTLNKVTNDVEFTKSQIKELQGMTPLQWLSKYRMGIAKTTSIGGMDRTKLEQEANDLQKEQELRLNNQLKAQLKAQEKAQAQLDKISGKVKPKTGGNEKNFVCPYCGAKFKTQAELNAHEKTCSERPKIGGEEDKQTPYQKAKEKWETAKDVSNWAPEEALRQWNKMVGGTAAGKEIEDFKQKQGELTKAKIEAELKAQNELALARLDGYNKQLKELDLQEAEELAAVGIGAKRKKDIQDKYTLDRNRVIAERDKQTLIDQASANALQMELEAQALADQGKNTEAAIKQEEAKWERTKATLTAGTDAYMLEYKKFLDTVATIQKDADEKLRAEQIESKKGKIEDQIQELENQKELADRLEDETKSKKLIAELEKKINDLKIEKVDIDIAELQRQRDAEKDTTKQLEIQNKINDALRERSGFEFSNVMINYQLNQPTLSTFSDYWKKGLDDAKAQIQQWGEGVQNIASTIVSGMTESFQSGFFDIIKGNFDDLEDVLTNFLDSITRSVTNMLGNAFVKKILSGSFGGWLNNLFGGTSKTTDAAEIASKAALAATTTATATSMTALQLVSTNLVTSFGTLAAAAMAATNSFSAAGTSGFSSIFAGEFASGGYIPPGQWGITGEHGPEPIFGGNSGITVFPNNQSSGNSKSGGSGGDITFNMINNSGNPMTGKIASKKTDSAGNQIITLVMDSIAKNKGGSRDFFKSL